MLALRTQAADWEDPAAAVSSLAMQIVKGGKVTMTKRKADAVTVGVLAAILVVISAVVMLGCAARVQTVTNLPPGVTQQQAKNWDAAVADLHKIAVTTWTLRQSVIALNKNGALRDGQAYVTMLSGIGRMDQLQTAAASLLQQSPQNFGAPVQAQVNGYVNQITAELTKLNATGATGIKDQSSLQQINMLLKEIADSANLVLAIAQ